MAGGSSELYDLVAEAFSCLPVMLDISVGIGPSTRSGHLDSVRALAISSSGDLLATASGITARAEASLPGHAELLQT